MSIRTITEITLKLTVDNVDVKDDNDGFKDDGDNVKKTDSLHLHLDLSA